MTYSITEIEKQFAQHSQTLSNKIHEYEAKLVNYPNVFQEFQQKVASKGKIDLKDDPLYPDHVEAKKKFNEFLELLKVDLEKLDNDEGKKILDEYKNLNSELQTLRRFAEFYNTYYTFTKNMDKFKNQLKIFCEKNKTLSSETKIQLEEYANFIEQLILFYQNLNLPSSIQADIPSTIQKLVEKLQSKEFTTYVFMLNELIMSQTEIDELLRPLSRELISVKVEEESLNPSNMYTSMPMQYLTKMPLIFRDISSDLNKIPNIDKAKDLAKTAQDLANKNSHSVNNQRAMYEDISKTMSNPKLTWQEKKIFFLRSILELHLNTPLQEIVFTKYSRNFFSTYLREIVEHEYKDKPKVLAALGVRELNENLFANPNYDAKLFENLFQETKDPFWLVLKSTLPVNELCPLNIKVDAYIQLAAHFSDGQLGKTEKYIGALNMAQDAYAIVNQFPVPEMIELIKKTFNFSQVDKSDIDPGKSKLFGGWILLKILKKEKKDPQAAKQAMEICNGLRDAQFSEQKSPLHRSMLSMLKRSKTEKLDSSPATGAAAAAIIDENPLTSLESNSSATNSDDDYLLIGDDISSDVLSEEIERDSEMDNILSKLFDFLDNKITIKEKNQNSQPAKLEQDPPPKKQGLARQSYFNTVPTLESDKTILSELKQTIVRSFTQDEREELCTKILRNRFFQNTIKLFIQENSELLSKFFKTPNDITVTELMNNLLKLNDRLSPRI
jgi:hypothetical protein